MSRPNFWRLKRKAESAKKSQIENPPKISQRTISSFFGSTKGDNLNEDENPKRPRHEGKEGSKEISVNLSSALQKLKSFSAFHESQSSVSSEDVNSENKHNPAASKPGKAETSDDIDNDVEMSQESSCSKTQSVDKLRLFSRKQSAEVEITQKTNNKLNKTGKVKYTPLEEQVIELRKKHPGVLLFVECGYKYRFFGEDAEVAARELNIYAHLDHNFMTASIPVHRLHAHVSRLVDKGYKVGVVKQTETAALKATSENKSAPFSREMQQVYTRATLIGGEVESIENNSLNLGDGVKAAHLFCLSEVVTDRGSHIAFVAVNPSTGETIFDEFKDTPSREQLFKRLQIINPAEILTPTNLSHDTERLLSHSQARLERIPAEHFEVTTALTRATSHMVSTAEEGQVEGLDKLTELPALVLACMAALLHHLLEFGLTKAVRLDELRHLAFGPDTLFLDASTIKNLELFSSGEGTFQGSFFWALNHTQTKFGARLLHKWIAEPLRDIKKLEERQNCITELLASNSLILSQLKELLSKLPDLERGLTTILHKKCSPAQFLATLESLCMLQGTLSTLLSNADRDFEAPLLKELILKTTELLSGVDTYTDNINKQAAKDGDKTKLLKDFSAFPTVVSRLESIKETTDSLDALLPDIARTLSVPSIQYFTVSGHEYLIEVKNANSKKVPVQWRKVNSTKQAGRYRPRAVDTLFSALQRLREQLKADCHNAWLSLLHDFSRRYFEYKQAIQNIAMLDVFFSLAHVARQEGYCRPLMFESDDPSIEIKRGRHPIVPLLFPSANQFVPNDTNLKSSAECCVVLSGPNMGGKSCYIRQVALIVIMAHIGSYVPAESARISLLKSIHTRMGAKDELFQGRSTLMVELEEASHILQTISKHSLVLMDELGRGTGTSDGSAIACATLTHLAVEVKCLSLFVTHYPSVMDAASELKGSVGNYHMAFLLHSPGEGEVLTFLYEVTKGAADRSYGINVARLANLSNKILQRASEVAKKLEDDVERRRCAREFFINVVKNSSEMLSRDSLCATLIRF